MPGQPHLTGPAGDRNRQPETEEPAVAIPASGGHAHITPRERTVIRRLIKNQAPRNCYSGPHVHVETGATNIITYNSALNCQTNFIKGATWLFKYNC